MTTTCQTCIHCSLDGIYCHLHQRPATPDGSCLQHTPMSGLHAWTAADVRKETKKNK